MTKPALARTLAILSSTTVVAASLVAAAPAFAVTTDLSTLRINEASSQGSPTDWVEILNTGTEAVDATGLVVKDNDDSHAITLPGGTTIAAGGLLTVYVDDATAWPGHSFGLGSADSARIFAANGTTLLDTVSWTAHVNSIGRVPDGTGAFVAISPATPGVLNAPSEEPEPVLDTAVVINEVESNGDDNDWVELANTADAPVDLSGYRFTDSHGLAGTGSDTPWVLAPGSIVPPHGFLVIEGANGAEAGFGSGLGGGDTVTLWRPAGDDSAVASYTWTTHATVTYGRYPDGTGAFIQTAVSTHGAPNIASPIRINEVTSQGSPADWVELVNVSASPVDLSGYQLVDSNGLAGSEVQTLPGGTTIAGNNGLLLVDLGPLGLGKGDSISLYDPSDLLLDSTSWGADHATPSWGRNPDGLGAFEMTAAATPGAPNIALEEVETEPWPGSDSVTAIDAVNAFPGDASGIDYEVGATLADDRLWIVRNKLGALYEARTDGTVVGQWTIRYPSGTGEPDAEGLALGGDSIEDGLYVATERDNAAELPRQPARFKQG
ncbi:MAG: lamin tail domain-containing protein, partial [Microbacteriaceae bacterium]|nr:lamin tail domain-containing protein [Microbacteriaceae bacterium]